MKILCLIAALLTGSCSSRLPGKEVDDKPTFIPWTEAMLRGAEFVATGDSYIVYMAFPSEGNHVSITAGNRKDGFSAPVWYWSLHEREGVVFTNYSGRRLVSLKLISFDERLVKTSQGTYRRLKE